MQSDGWWTYFTGSLDSLSISSSSVYPPENSQIARMQSDGWWTYFSWSSYSLLVSSSSVYPVSSSSVYPPQNSQIRRMMDVLLGKFRQSTRSSRGHGLMRVLCTPDLRSASGEVELHQALWSTSQQDDVCNVHSNVQISPSEGDNALVYVEGNAMFGTLNIHPQVLVAWILYLFVQVQSWLQQLIRCYNTRLPRDSVHCYSKPFKCVNPKLGLVSIAKLKQGQDELRSSQPSREMFENNMKHENLANPNT